MIKINVQEEVELKVKLLDIPCSMPHVISTSDQAQILAAPLHASHFGLVTFQTVKKNIKKG